MVLLYWEIWNVNTLVNFINEKYYVKYLSLISICKFMSDN